MSDDLSNTPPRPEPLSRAQVTAYLDYQLEPLKTDRDDRIIPALIAIVQQHPTIEDGDEETAAKFVDNIRLARELAGSSSSRAKLQHTEHKRPFLEGGRAVDAWFHAFEEPLARAIAPAMAALQSFADRKDAAARRAAEEQRRRDAEEAQRRADAAAAEAAEKAKTAGMFSDAADEAAAVARVAQQEAEKVETAPVVGRTQTRSAYTGSVASNRRSWSWEVRDPAKVPRDFLTIDTDAIKEAARVRDPATNRPVVEIPGIAWVESTKVNIR